jgi:site-specific DNA-methyltransferase (adenine-specific)
MSARNLVLVGDVRERLADIPGDSVDCVITSPPYYQLRNYGNDAQLGLEATVDEWAEGLRHVLREVGRVLKPTGVVWVNLGDSYSRHGRHGAPSKSLLLGPERFSLKAIEDGWVMRSKVVWAKSNPMPSSVRDRLSSTWEVVYMFTREGGYFFDLDAIRTPHRSTRAPRPEPRQVGTVYPAPGAGAPAWTRSGNRALAEMNDRGEVGHPLGKNPGDVWQTGTASFRGAHFATFPAKLIERPLLATCPEKVCAGCGRPWEREPMRRLGQLAVRGELRKRCGCDRGWKPGLVLDPFLGSGTVALAAIAHDRDWLGIELNPDYAAIAERRIGEASEPATGFSEPRAA